MKATIQKPAFSPIILTLETEAEAKAIYAVLNNVKLGQALGFPGDFSPRKVGLPEDLYDQPTHTKVCAALK